jgi:hypothetical protein
MDDFLPGDIIIVDFHYEENNQLFKKRPSMVVSKIDTDSYCIAKITKTNLVEKVKGEWIDEHSKEYVPMGLGFPSFIRLENLISVPKSLIKPNRIGIYPEVEKLFKIHNINTPTKATKE